MKGRRLAVLIATAVVCCACAIAVLGCGGGETSGSTEATTAESVGTSDQKATTTTAPTTTTIRDTAAYAADMRAWFDKYSAKFEQGGETLDLVFDDPLGVTEQELQDLKDFASVVGDAVRDLEEIEPTPDLASAHADYLETLRDMATGLPQLVEPLRNKDLTAALEILEPLGASTEKGNAARETLEKALGI